MPPPNPLSDLRELEAESIGILREVVAEAQRPVMLYSAGKDSSVMLHLALKAFHPAPPPFPLLHVDTGWKFRELVRFRDRRVAELGLELIVHRNRDGARRGVTPDSHGSEIYTRIMKTDALKQALDARGFDMAFGGARREEERSRAKERVLSIRGPGHSWDPRDQRPELRRLFNCRLNPGESLRAFVLSDWTELDIWRYIAAERIEVPPLYFAARRPVVERDGLLIVVDDDRLPLAEGETPEARLVRFRTLGCYPLTGAVESAATNPGEIIEELRATRTTERSGRAIDRDTPNAMEAKKREGYF